MQRGLIVFLFLFLAGRISAQEPYYNTISKLNGLPSNTVYDLFQDHDGFIWLASNEGLSKYDGYEFKTYTNSSQHSKAGSNIAQDHLGRIWYENFDGNLFYIEHDSLRTFRQNTPGGFFKFALLGDRLLTIQEKGCDIYDLNTLQLLNTISLKSAVSSAVQSGGYYYIMTDDGLLRLDRNGKADTYPLRLNRLNESPGIMSESGQGILMVDRDNANKKCYSTAAGKVVDKFPLPHLEYIWNVSYTGGYNWFCCKNGVYAYDHTGKAINSNAYFPDKTVSDVLKDREGNYWFSTTDEGIIFVPSLEVEMFRTTNLSAQSITSINNKGFCIGTGNNGIYFFGPDLHTSKLVVQHPDKHKVYYLYYDSIINELFYTSSVFNSLSLADKKVKVTNIDMAMKDICKLDDSYYAYASSGSCGLFTLGGDTKSSAWDSLYKASPNSGLWANARRLMSSIRGRSVAYIPSTHSIYFATGRGLYRASPKEIKEITYAGNSLFLLSIGSYGSKLYAMDMQRNLLVIDANDHIEPLQEPYKEGAAIKQMKVLDHYLFILTDNGLVYTDLNKENLVFRKVYVDLKRTDIKDFTRSGNTLVIVTSTGLLRINYQEIKLNTPQPVFIINNLKVNNEILPENKKREFTHNQNNIEISYSILSFKTGSEFPLYYQVNQSGWQLAPKSSRILRFASLSPGDYTIRFHLGEPSQNKFREKVISFRINKPFWLSGWFLGLSGGIIMLLAYLYYRNRLQTLIRQNHLLTEKILLEQNVDRLALTSIRSQMNPHFFFNALNTIQSFIFSNDKYNAATYLSKFSKLTRIILEMSEKENISLDEEIIALTLYLELEKARFSNDFHFSVTVTPGFDTEMTRIPTMLVQPYVENAVKHGLLHKEGKKELIIRFSKEENILIILIEDNGIGRKRSAELNKSATSRHTPFSTEANRKRMELLNKGNKKIEIQITDKYDAAGNAAGTKIIIHIKSLKD